MTREEAIKILEYPVKKWSMEWDEREDGLSYYEALDMAISALRQKDHFREVTKKVEPQWISVKDKVPEAGGYVVCIAKRNPFSRFMPMVARIEKNGWANPITDQYISEVTHWMPMPEPPEEGTV